MIRIVSDSSTLYTVEEGLKNNIDIAPLSVTINNKTYIENEEITTEEFIDIINEGHVPISSQPSIGQVVDIYNKYPNDEIINISMADGLSGTYNSACTAKTLAEHPENIDVVNSKTLCLPHKYLVDVAAKLASLQNTKEEILKEIHALIETSESYLIPNDFNFLVRGGRLSPLVGRIGTAIKLVPVMTLSKDGTRLESFTTKRTLNKAISKIADHFINLGVNNNFKIFICHACKLDLANTAKEVILSKISDADIEISKLSPAFTTQGGPGCISVQIIRKHVALS